MKVAVLWTGLSGYLNACLKELAGREGVQLFVSYQVPHGSAPFDESQFAWIEDRLSWRTQCDFESLNRRVRAFAPDIMVLASWHVPSYRRIAKALANQCWRVMSMDNPWDGTLRQRFGVLIAPSYVLPMADAVWLPGDRQSVFARKLGFGQKAILRGSLSCDRPIFETVHLTRIENRQPLPRAFIFAGRFSPEKGVDVLAKAYQIYHDNHENPWPLVCCGSGPLQPMLEGRAGIRIEGFIQPDDLPTKFGAAGCLIVPSNWDHWSVVVHEATCAGLLVLASEVVGAVAHLVQPNFNGFIFSKGDAAELAVLMSRVSSSCDVRLNAMSEASFLLSQQFSPTRWADTLLESFAARNS